MRETFHFSQSASHRIANAELSKMQVKTEYKMPCKKSRTKLAYFACKVVFLSMSYVTLDIKYRLRTVHTFRSLIKRYFTNQEVNITNFLFFLVQTVLSIKQTPK